jgi:predicted NUDIX family NTP pyrophosphohydrolase
MKESAGTLLYRVRGEAVEVLIVHPSGNYNRKAPWSIPKGLPEEGESLLDAARRETREETGVDSLALELLGTIQYTKTRKRVHAFVGQPAGGDPHCASWEVDRAEFVPLERAAELLHPDQRPLLELLKAHLERQ